MEEEHKEDDNKKRKREKMPMKPLSVKELDNFYKRVSMDMNQQMNDPNAHMIFCTEHYKKKKLRECEETPMFYFRGGYISAQRISYFLEYQIDPVKKSKIYLLCNNTRCINPKHLSLEPQK